MVESLPVSEDIKKQKGDWREHIENYRVSLRHLAAAGIEVVCYNFMPVLDWTRTDLAWRVSHGGTCMRFDYADFAAFDIHILDRKGAAEDYPDATREDAARALPPPWTRTASRRWPATSSSACPARPRASPSTTCARTSPSTAPSRPTSSAPTSSPSWRR